MSTPEFTNQETKALYHKILYSRPNIVILDTIEYLLKDGRCHRYIISEVQEMIEDDYMNLEITKKADTKQIAELLYLIVKRYLPEEARCQFP